MHNSGRNTIAPSRLRPRQAANYFLGCSDAPALAGAGAGFIFEASNTIIPFCSF
jgi:hypothetical protein